jgi:hypothetical protein
MKIVNRRNAVAGWVALAVGKRVVKRKARAAVPTVDPETRKPNRSAVLLGLAGVFGALAFWRKRSGDSELDEQQDDS